MVELEPMTVVFLKVVNFVPSASLEVDVSLSVLCVALDIVISRETELPRLT